MGRTGLYASPSARQQHARLDCSLSVAGFRPTAELGDVSSQGHETDSGPFVKL